MSKKGNTLFKKLLKSYSTKFSLSALIILILLSLIACNHSKISSNNFELKSSNKYPAASTADFNINSNLDWPHENSDLIPDPALFFGKLPNGFRYVLMKNTNPQNRVSIHLNIQAGSMYETDKQLGLSHFIEHMLFCGSKHFKPGDLVKYFQSIGMQFGPDANAHTGFYETGYDILLPEGNKQSLEKGLAVMKEFAEGALLLQTEIDKEHKVILAEKRTRDSASYRTFVSVMKFLLPEARMSKRFPIGEEEVIKNADHDLLKIYYDTWYRPDNMIIVMAGDFDQKQATKLINEKFSTLSARAPIQPRPDIGVINHKGIKTFYHFEKETGKTTATIEVINKRIMEPDSASFKRKQLLKNIADQIVQNRLDKIVSKTTSPFTSASISSSTSFYQVEFSEISAETSPENWEESLSLLEKTLRKSLKYGFTKSELEIVKKDFLSKLDNAVKKMPTRNSSMLAGNIVQDLNNEKVTMSPEQERNLLAPIINSINLKDVHDAFKDAWAANHRLIMVTGNAKITAKNKTPEDLIYEVFDRSSRVKVLRPSEIKPAVFPYLAEPEKKGKIINRTEIPDLGIVQIDFDNGIRLNLKQTDFEADEVLVNLSFGFGKSAEPSNMAGLAELSEQVINESGLGSLKKEEIKRAMAGKNTNLIFGFDEDCFLFKGITVSKEVPLLFQLIYAHLIDQAYRQEAYSLSMERFKQQYRKLSSSIDGAMLLSGKRLLAGGDTRFGLPPYHLFKNLTLEQVSSWIHNPLKQDKLEISVVGDFDMDSLIETAAKYLGGLPQRSTYKTNKISTSPEFPAAQLFEISVATKIQKGVVIVAYPTEDIWDINRTRRLSVLADIFSNRLRERIREKLGAAYSSTAYNQPGKAYPGYGVFQAFVHVDPDDSDLIVSEIKGIALDLVEKGIQEDELRRSLDPTITSIKDLLRKNEYWLNTVLSGSLRHPQKLDWSRTIMQGYSSITSDDLSKTAKKYLDNEKAATIIIKPEKAIKK
ncbi:MAG: insulinase family protein [Proteobacteria bacterium]|nr:insulinase family protein [Pseudomonadota bacterium]MBU4068276.1 insulinase family protein [Pseudomonadota bacterium]